MGRTTSLHEFEKKCPQKESVKEKKNINNKNIVIRCALFIMLYFRSHIFVLVHSFT